MTETAYPSRRAGSSGRVRRIGRRTLLNGSRGFTLLLTLTIACTPGDPPSQAPARQVAVRGRAFAPATLEVPSGTEITWTNLDPEPHTIVSGSPAASNGDFDESLDAPGSAASITLDAAGRYPYFCALHPEMTGEIVVTPA